VAAPWCSSPTISTPRQRCDRVLFLDRKPLSWETFTTPRADPALSPLYAIYEQVVRR
jgi:hypothetical protein